MFIDKSMTKDVIAVSPQMSILEARDIMVQKGIRHLPVVSEGDILVGILTDRDLRAAMPSVILSEAEKADGVKRLAGITVQDIMTADPVTVSPAQTLEDALLLMERHKVGAFPVVDLDGRLRGIISVRDLMRAFVTVLGLRTPGVLIGIVVDDKLGQMKKIVDAISELGVSFGSVLVARVWEEGKRAVFPYLLTNNVARVKKHLLEKGFTLLDPMEWCLDQVPKK
ncbi:MAG: CBS and ACT domain-containing protein [Syntrophobacteraceae bacterium]|nr:CBS and ACT domain-containing protein [Syntrophobacteraceae bacterium]